MPETFHRVDLDHEWHAHMLSRVQVDLPLGARKASITGSKSASAALLSLLGPAESAGRRSLVEALEYE